MKLKVFTMVALTAGLALVVALTVAAQETEVRGTNLHVVSTGSPASPTALQNATTLGYTSEITFTPAFTSYLPAVFKGYGACSTIPTLMSPANGSSLSTLIPLFQWDSGNDPNATQLRLQVAKDPDFTQGVWSLWHGSGTGVGEFRFSRNLDPARAYYWRAWLLCGDTAGPYSDVWSFTTGSGGTILPAPTLVAPPNGSAVPTTTVTLQWSPVGGAVEYLVRWREVGQGGYNSDWVAETQTTIGWLSANTTYEWWVSARNDYAIGADSETWQFTTPAGSSSVSLQDLNCCSFVIEGGSTTIVFEGQDSK
ncbi:MAG TPA: fibronectin type III domain-containing protein [Anaerolineae bacterium]|nr:fibronectin type III domain-containing protein [Anaerolineae bacterium]HQH39107.1 fibronectin type III domain-containing protein [Anaerolineae bacterium]